MSKKHEYKIRARYSEIDGMKNVHNSKYLIYFEEARIDLVRTHGYPYEQIEKEGIIFPMSEAKLLYKKSIYYDELIIVDVTIAYIKNFSFKFNYKIRKSDNTIACEGHTIHAFIDKNTGDFTNIPDKLRNIFEQYQ